MRRFTRYLSIFGALTFASAFVASYIFPTFVETFAGSILRIEIEKHVDQKIQSLEGNRISELATRFAGTKAPELADLKRKLTENLAPKIATIAAEMRDPNCPCRNRMEAMLSDAVGNPVSELSRQQERLSALIRTRYLDTAASLTREFRIFTAANALIFVLLGATMAFRRKAGAQLLLAAIVLIGAATLAGFLYLFKQNGLHTVVFADYVGLGYFAYPGLAIACLADIFFNRGRVTTRALNSIFDMIGSAIHVAPC